MVAMATSFRRTYASKLQIPGLLWKFCNQIPLAFKVKFPGGSQSFCWIPRLENLLWALKLSQQCETFFGKIVLQFVDYLLGGSMVGLTCCASQVCCSQSPSPWALVLGHVVMESFPSVPVTVGLVEE